MGSGEQAVVDPSLRVRGVEGLRGRRRVSDAESGAGQHQRADDHDRGEGRRPHQERRIDSLSGRTGRL